MCFQYQPNYRITIIIKNYVDKCLFNEKNQFKTKLIGIQKEMLT